MKTKFLAGMQGRTVTPSQEKMHQKEARSTFGHVRFEASLVEESPEVH